MKKLMIVSMGIVSGFCAFGRGEWFVPKPATPPPVETLTNTDRYIEWKWRTDVTDKTTGSDRIVAKSHLQAIVKDLEGKEPWCVVKAKCFQHLCEDIAIDVSPYDWFPAVALWNRYERPMSPVLGRRDSIIGDKYYPQIKSEMYKGNKEGKWMVWKDFDHIVPEWDVILKLGFPGMRKRLQDNWQEKPYYTACGIVSDATLHIIDRFIAQGRKRIGEYAGDEAGRVRLEKQVASLRRLRNGAPETALDAMQFIYLYFVLSEHFDAIQCRSLSIIDKTLWPYYQKDIAAGRTTEKEFREQFKHFLWQWGSIDNYWGQPITMGGTKADGSSEYNPLSMVILEVMDECALPTPKFHLKIASNTPDEVLYKALAMARRHRPISFIGEAPIRKLLESHGYTADEARQFYTKGCYEFCVPKDGNGLGGGHINLLKQVELMLGDAANGRFEAATFDDFRREYMKRVAEASRKVMGFFYEFEKHLDDVNPANFPSLAGSYSVKTGKDMLSNGTISGNTTGICLSGLGTAVDALMAVKEIVYDRKDMTLSQLGQLMAANWEGREDLRLRMMHSKRKWGNNDPEANAIGSEISKVCATEINGKPNSRNGKFWMSGHNARQFIEEGKLTGATPDGRKKGEEFSKNLSPTMGVDTEGVTALIGTLSALDPMDFPGDFPLDVMLLPYTVSGEKGLQAMKSLLFQYYANDGFMMQFNVFDAEELIDAQKHPEKYENLQVRVCGWNVRWNDLCKAEQDAYIRRAQEIAR